MSYADFFKALTPYNYTEMKDMSEYFEKNQIEALKLADVNGDGVIDFTEFFFFITIMQIPETIVEDVFRKHGDKPDTISAEDFGKVLSELRKNTILGSKQKNKSFLDARLVKASEEDFMNTNKSIAKHMLKGDTEISLVKFMEYREDLKTALRHFEFHNYDVDENNTISCEDFAKSLLVCLPIKTSQNYVKRIHSLNLEGRVTFKEFIAFQNFIDNADQIKKKILAYKYITFEQLVDLAGEFCKKDDYCQREKTSISNAQLDAFLRVMDLDGNGNLDYGEIMGVLEGRLLLGQGQEDQLKEAIQSGSKKVVDFVRDLVKDYVRI